MMRKFQFLFLFCFITMAAAGQNEFLLYSFKGNVSVVEKNVESKAKVGKPLTSTSTIKVAAGGVVTLICNEAAMFTINKAGTYQLNKFGDSCKISSNSVSANYVKYVWASMTKSSGSAGSNRKQYMNTVGAVPRSLNPIWFDPRMRLDTLNYSGLTNNFPLSWKSFSDSKDYEFSLFTADNISTPIHTAFVDKLKIPVTDFVSKMKPGNSYYWTVAVKGEENDELMLINYVTKASFETFVASLKSMGAAYETPAEQNYRIGFMLEDARYLSEAYLYYSKASTLDPANMLYRSTLMSFKKDYEIK